MTARYIDADALIDRVTRMWENRQLTNTKYKCFTEMLIAEPTVDVVERNRWIPVYERLPETDDMMLVTCQPKKGLPNVNRAFYMNGSWHGSGSMSGVTAWMPLPEPYRERRDDEADRLHM